MFRIIKKAVICSKMDTLLQENPNFQVTECSACQVWMYSCARGALGPLGSPGCSGNAGGCTGIQQHCSFPPRLGTAAPSVFAQKCLSTAGLSYLIQRPTATKTLKMRSWPEFCSLLRWKDIAGHKSPEKFLMLFTVLLHNYLARNSSYRSEEYS